MPSGTHTTEPGRLNMRQARDLAYRIQQALPGWRVSPLSVAQGLATVELTGPGPTFEKHTVRSEEDWPAVRDRITGSRHEKPWAYERGVGGRR